MKIPVGFRLIFVTLLGVSPQIFVLIRVSGGKGFLMRWPYNDCYMQSDQNESMNVQPLPSSEASETSPPCSLTMCLTIARPSPVPPISRLRALSTL